MSATKPPVVGRTHIHVGSTQIDGHRSVLLYYGGLPFRLEDEDAQLLIDRLQARLAECREHNQLSSES